MAKSELKLIPQTDFSMDRNGVIYNSDGTVYADPRKQKLSQVTIYTPHATLLTIHELQHKLFGTPLPVQQ